MAYPDNPQWRVMPAGIHEETQLAEHGGGLEVVHHVPYMIQSGPARGHYGVVRVQHHDFTPESVREAIDAAVARVHNVAGLTSDNV